ncbi:hypothetical protein KI688_009736 [Linnemannia hyalina]|uniref:HTH psq-type domain-containing protein n=1 Tax=Linnemannia hyalina TaxID=64524 RepID=A0A9P7XZF5_9FUNG|nr:hypothetical protein KI688_009736 [Linnemannia hyalina]
MRRCVVISSWERIIELVVDQAKTMAMVARNFNIPASTVRSIANTFIQANRISQLPRGGSRISRVQQSHLDWLIENMDEFAGRLFELLTNQLNEHFQIQPPLSQRTVDRAIDKLTAYTLKLMRADAERYNEPEHIESRRQ